jgi:hypothetical protein
VKYASRLLRNLGDLYPCAEHGVSAFKNIAKKKILQAEQWNLKHKLSNLTNVKSFYNLRFEPWKSASTTIFVNENVAVFDSQ